MSDPHSTDEATRDLGSRQSATPRGFLFLLLAAEFLVSAAGLIVEIVAGRMLAPYVGMSLYTWTAVIAIVLLGLTLGHWYGGRLAERPTPAIARGIAISLAFAALSTAAILPLLRWLSEPVLAGFGASVPGIVALSILLLLLPSFFVGVPAPALTKIAIDTVPDQTGRVLGRMYAAGALGAIAGTLLAGYLFISWLGTARTLASVAIVDAALAAIFWAYARRERRQIATACLVAAALIAGGAGLVRSSSACTLESNYYCIRSIDMSGDIGSPARLMVLDHLGHGINLRDEPRRLVTPYVATMDYLRRIRFAGRAIAAYFIGGGAFTLPRAWTARESPDAVTVAEVDPMVTDIAIRDFWVDGGKMTIMHADARRALRQSSERFSMIVGDAFTDIAVPQHLVTREFFELVRDRLTADGAYVMNLVDHLDRLDALAAVHRTLADVFPVVEVWVEAEDFAGGGRTTFVLLAGQTETKVARFRERGGGRTFARIPAARMEKLIAEHDPPVLTDDYAPIDRLMGALGE